MGTLHVRVCKMAAKFKVGDLVWAKIKGFSNWPAKITEPVDGVKKPNKPKGNWHFVLFFGQNNFAWCHEDQISYYSQHREKYQNSAKLSKVLKGAMDEIEEVWQALPDAE